MPYMSSNLCNCPPSHWPLQRVLTAVPGPPRAGDPGGAGPLTNLAIGMLADPGLGARLASLVIMGGNMEAIGNVTTSAEFNFHADPEAAHTVLR